jgi:hypothetical protein
MDAKLVLVRKDAKPTVIKLNKLPMTVGRGKEADLTIAHPMVSRLHCELYETENTLCIRDMGSLNGTFVGESQITEAALESGDELIIGAARFQVLIDEDVEAGKEIEAPAVAASDETGEEGGSIVEATEFEELEQVEEFDEALAETDEGVEALAETDEGVEALAETDEEELAEVVEIEEEKAAEALAEDAEQLAVGEPSEVAGAEEEPAEAEQVTPFEPEPVADESQEKEAAASGKIDLGIPSDEPAKVDDDDDLQDFLAGLK